MSNNVDGLLFEVLDGVETASFVQDSVPFEFRLMRNYPHATMHALCSEHGGSTQDPFCGIGVRGKESVGSASRPVTVENWRSAQMATRLVFWKRLAR